MRRDLVTATIAIVLFTLVLGVGYPLAMTGVSQSVFPGRANGSKLTRDGTVVGSALLGQAFTLKGSKRPDPKYFQPRPSATGYAPDATFFANRGPNSAAARSFYRDGLRAYVDRERPYDRGLTAASVPVDAVTTSASGVDPHISPANAAVQAHRVAAVRHLPLDRVRSLIGDSTDGRFLGLAGEPGVNVLRLNLALDKETPVS